MPAEANQGDVTEHRLLPLSSDPFEMPHTSSKRAAISRPIAWRQPGMDRRRRAQGKELDDGEAEDETADMGSIGHPAAPASQGPNAFDDLEHEPQTDGHERRHVGEKSEHQDRHASLWEQDQVSSQNSRDRPRRSKRRHQRILIEGIGRGHMRPSSPPGR